MTDVQMPERKSGHGCFYYGCLSTLIVLLIAAAGIGFIVYKVRGALMSCTSTIPVEMPIIQVSQEQLAALNRKIEAFSQALSDDRPARLVLSVDEINAELNSEYGLRSVGGKAFVQIDGEMVTADFSMPTDSLLMKGRYLNGQARVVVSLEDGKLQVFLDDASAGGKPLPKPLMTALRSKNLAEKAMANPRLAAAIARIKRISVEDGYIVLEH